MASTEYHTPVWSIGDRMAKARKLAGLSQEQMAEALSTPSEPVSKQTVSNWENDTNQPRRLRQRLDQWAEITGVSLAWLLAMPVGDHYQGERQYRCSAVAPALRMPALA
jgi:transcriptional regulator with XRE-family HTH domain